MNIIKPYVIPVFMPDYPTLLRVVEGAARTCYKSENKICDGSAEKLISSCIKRGHESVIEHVGFTVRFVCDRGVTHELVRHRIGVAFSQESTRYCDYGGKDVEFIEPWWYSGAYSREKDLFDAACKAAETSYQLMREAGMSPQAARAVLPNAIKTEIVVTANMREWRHIFRLRCDKAAHPDMVRVMSMARDLARSYYPAFFADLAQ